MSDIMALDIETSNYSWEIGGWDNKALFDVSVVATWDGKDAHIFTKLTFFLLFMSQCDQYRSTL